MRIPAKPEADFGRLKETPLAPAILLGFGIASTYGQTDSIVIGASGTGSAWDKMPIFE